LPLREHAIGIGRSIALRRTRREEGHRTWSSDETVAVVPETAVIATDGATMTTIRGPGHATIMITPRDGDTIIVDVDVVATRQRTAR
jgi:hypothetical protein